MTPAATLGAYAGALTLVFTAALGVGGAVGPVGAASTASTAGTAGAQAPAHSTGAPAHGDDHAMAATGAAPDLAPGGLAVAADGHALELATTTQAAGAPSTFRFTVTGPDGRPLTAYAPSHDEDLHLVVVRRDLTGYQHLHPIRDAQGTWSVPLTLAEPGPYKVFADFVPEGRDRSLVLAADLTAPGPYSPEPLPAPAQTTSVDGYGVSLDGESRRRDRAARSS